MEIEKGDIILLNVKKDNWYHISDSSYKKIEPNEINDRNAIILFYEKI
jgi:ubiquitin C-terminal hydrolase